MKRLNTWLVAFWGCLVVVSCCLMPYAASAATQTVSGMPVQIIVLDSGAPTINVWDGSAYVAQYCCGTSQADWGSYLWLNGTSAADAFNTNNGQGWGGVLGDTTNATPVSNTTNVVGPTSTITTVVSLGSTAVTLTQKIIYTQGDRFVTKTWDIANGGATTFSDLRFFHGGDTLFGGDDSAYGFYDAANSMVYIRNADFVNWGIMGFYANPATPANHYFEGGFWLGLNMASEVTGGVVLTDTVDSSYQDAGYMLQWNRASLAPGATWSIISYEQWTTPGALQVIAPGGQNVVANSTVDLNYTVQNLAAASVTANLSASATNGWTATVQSTTPATIAANGNTSVVVRVTVPAGANPADTSLITLTATDQAAPGNPKTGQTTLTVISVNLGISTGPVAFGTVLPNSSNNRTVTLTNNSGSSMTFGTVGGTNPLAAPFSISNDTCSGATLAAGATCTFVVNFNPVAAATFSDSLNIPLTSPIIISQTLAVSGVAQAQTYSGPVPVPTINEWGMIVFALFAGLGSAYYLRRRMPLA